MSPVSVEKVKYYMAEVDGGITTHQSGPFGDLYFSTKVLEYMTQGLPVLCSKTPAIEHYIPERAIFYFTPHDVDDLADAVLRMYRNPDLVEQRVKSSRELLSRYVWQEEKGRFISFYDDLVRNHRA